MIFVVNQNDAARSNYEIIEIGSWIGGTVRLR